MKTLALTLRLGATADIPIRIESDELTFAPITAMTKSAPVRITSTGHGIPDGWRAAVLNAGGMTELNATWNAIRDSDISRGGDCFSKFWPSIKSIRTTPVCNP